ncbi:MAG TPA: hypothetical protein PLX06_02970, partial [Fimbriimonadaceae bacterium]|nr:hypothetical protein [Fimbriimonadaceae bacterium]
LTWTAPKEADAAFLAAYVRTNGRWKLHATAPANRGSMALPTSFSGEVAISVLDKASNESAFTLLR